MSTRSDSAQIPDTPAPVVLKRNGTSLRQLVVPATPALPEWLLSQKAEIRAALLRDGAIRLTGTTVTTPPVLAELATGLSGPLVEYTERTTPRAQIHDRIYSSTEYPAAQRILQHNEMSYTSYWPDHLFFCSAVTAEQGGQTPVADSRTVMRNLPAELVRRFEDLGVMYTRAYHPGLGLAWPEVFQTDDRGEVENYCIRNDIEWMWEGELLRTTQRRPAVVEHPVTGERVWFNQAHLFHVRALDQDSAAALLDLFDEQDLPSNAYYGDGTPISEDDLAAIGQAYNNAMLTPDWSDGDVLILDNVLMSHGRAPYRGERKVLAAMTCTDWAAWR